MPVFQLSFEIHCAMLHCPLQNKTQNIYPFNWVRVRIFVLFRPIDHCYIHEMSLQNWIRMKFNSTLLGAPTISHIPSSLRKLLKQHQIKHFIFLIVVHSILFHSWMNLKSTANSQQSTIYHPTHNILTPNKYTNSKLLFRYEHSCILSNTHS